MRNQGEKNSVMEGKSWNSTPVRSPKDKSTFHILQSVRELIFCSSASITSLLVRFGTSPGLLRKQRQGFSKGFVTHIFSLNTSLGVLNEQGPPLKRNLSLKDEAMPMRNPRAIFLPQPQLQAPCLPASPAAPSTCLRRMFSLLFNLQWV